jgi:acyl-CoA thioesterase
MTDDDHERRILSGAALFESMGGFHVVDWDAATKSLTAAFTIRREFCHTNATICQGGFITAWLDAAMAHAVLYDSDKTLNVASLEIKVSFLERVGPGAGRAIGRIVRRGNKVAFMEGELITPDGRIGARATTTGMLVPMSKR